MAQGYYTLQEAAQFLQMSPDELKQLAQKKEIRSFQDRGVLRFREQDVQELGRRRGTVSSEPELIVRETPPSGPKSGPKNPGQGGPKTPPMSAPKSPAGPRTPKGSSSPAHSHPYPAELRLRGRHTCAGHPRRCLSASRTLRVSPRFPTTIRTPARAASRCDFISQSMFIRTSSPTLSTVFLRGLRRSS